MLNRYCSSSLDASWFITTSICLAIGVIIQPIWYIYDVVLGLRQVSFTIYQRSDLLDK